MKETTTLATYKRNGKNVTVFAYIGTEARKEGRSETVQVSKVKNSNQRFRVDVSKLMI
jgi:hypothetical protein